MNLEIYIIVSLVGGENIYGKGISGADAKGENCQERKK